MGWGLWRTPEPRPFVCERHRDSHHERCGPSCGTGSESCSPPASELHLLPSQPRPSNARLAPTAPRSEWRPGHANKPEHLPHAGRGARAAPRLVYNTEISPHHSTLSTLLLTPGCPRGVRPIKAEVGQSSSDPISSHRGHSADVILAHNYEYMSSMSHPAIKVLQLHVGRY